VTDIPLENLATIIRGVTFSKSEGTSLPGEGLLPVIRAGSIQQSLLLDKDQIWIPKERISKKQLLRKDDIVMCTSSGSSDLVGKCAKADQDWTGSFGAFCAGIRPDPELCDPSYLYHFLNSPRFRNWTKRSSGANIKNIRASELAKFPVPKLSLKEQKRIAAILDKADAIRRKRQQAIQLADEFLRSVFLDMFGDPVTNPKGWNMVALGKVCGVGSSKRVFVDELTDSGVPFFRGTEVGQLGDYEDISPRLFISEEHYEKLKKDSGVPKVGDLLLPSICHDGRIWKMDHELPFYFKDGRVLWIKVDNKNVNSDYLRNHLKILFLSNYSKIASGTTFAELKIVNLKNLKILVPPLVLQKKYSEITCTARQISDRHKRTLEQEVSLFHSLSQRAFRGDL